MLEKLFRLKELDTSVRREVIAGCTTFMTLSYIIFVNPILLSIPSTATPAAGAGMDYGAVMVATCLASALAMFLMGFLTNYPIALAPGMGINAYFSFVVCGALGLGWQEALGIVFISGALFVLLSFVGVRETLMNSLPSSLQNAMAGGIGLFIAFIGLQMSGIVVSNPATFVTLGNLGSTPVLLALAGITITLLLMARKVPGAILIGILVTAVLNLAFGLARFEGIVSAPPSLAPTFLALRFPDFSQMELIPVIFVFFSVDMFDSVGTFTATSQQAGLLQYGRLPKARNALLADAVGSTGGALLGTSTVTSYIESASGIATGGRTGLTTIVTGLLMLVALFFSPLVKIVGGGYAVSPGVTLYPVIAPALIVVGCLMLKPIVNIKWDDITEAIPAFLCLVMMPFSFSITDGIALGFISTAILKIATNRRKEVHEFIYYFAVFFIARYIGFA